MKSTLDILLAVFWLGVGVSLLLVEPSPNHMMLEAIGSIIAATSYAREFFNN